MPIESIKKAVLLVWTAGLLGCAPIEPRGFKMPAAAPEAFSRDGTEALCQRWWESLNDPNLNRLIETALENNFSIRSAWDRLSQAEQTARIAGAGLFPQAGYSTQAQRSRTEASDIVNYSSAYSAGASISYELDFWGRIRSLRQAAVLDAQAAADDIQTAAITLSAAAAKTWYQLAEAKQQAGVIQKQLEINEKVLAIILTQFAQGLVGASDVLRQKQLVESSRGQAVQNQETLVLLQHQLSVLCGEKPGLVWTDTPMELPEPAGLPAIGLPSDVLQRRPDVQKAYKAVQAADLRLAAAIADQYPSIGLFAGAETSAQQTKDLFEDWLANLAADITGPLFDAGLRKAEIARWRAAVSQKLNEYGQTILTALKETEDALAQEDYQRQYMRSLQEQLRLARQVYERNRDKYLQGQMDYLRVLESLISLQSLERQELSARRILLERRIDLYRSIAGSWPIDRPQQTAIVYEQFE
ncbi:MAG TPA: TolC family protein [Anaerohalosphaeraceae bacterium]|nr:TolC family protein [Phycisphaerae bacterium]HOL31776.1 TolC family protein [Anaerohalosphaeraceae bacterium]HOM76799.1 TolC family protein [Anaerohalosphaeraceae bacterium]HPC64384.1 TolC family protein [Anaerohalosphaeraceae bacterium]HPO70469.1 TolC family protein [Anaerohalosphaeraceae bacterium]